MPMNRTLSCTSCQTELLVGARFCIACGSKALLHCAACDSDVPVAALHCPSCGAALGSARAQASVERRQVSVMFCDLVGSTAIAVRLDPEDTREINLAYEQTCLDIVSALGGFISRYEGDGIVVYFGYPKAREDAVESAVRAGLAIAAAVPRLSNPHGVELQVRVGIATGLVVVGDIVGSGPSRQHQVVGETPNLAARLQALAEPGSVVISESTRRLVGERFRLRDLGTHELKGFAEPVPAWAVTDTLAAASRFRGMHRRASRDLLGRGRDAEALLACQRAAWAGLGQAVLISGEAGIGKSHLVSWLAGRLAGHPHVKLQYQCSLYHQGSALHPVIAQLGHASGFEPADDGARRLDKLEALLSRAGPEGAADAPLFAALLSVQGESRYAPLSMGSEEQRRRTLDALLRQLEGLARRQPVLVVFEDLQWADATTLELLGTLLERIASLPVLALLTCRPEFRAPWAQQGKVSTMALGRLEAADARAMVERLAAAAGALDDAVVAGLVDRSDGVPLYIEELTKSVLDAAAGSGQGPIPASLRDSLAARLDRLAAVRELAQIGAAIGRDFSFELLRAVSAREGHALADAALEDAMRQLQDAGLLARREGAADHAYRFRHALVQQAAYDTLLKSRRQAIHLRIAEALRADFARQAEQEPEVLAHHYTHAGAVDQALVWWQRAGEWAVGRSAYAEAASHLQRALDLALALPAGPVQRSTLLGLHITLGQVMIASRGYASPESLHSFRQARRLVTEIEDASQRYSVYYGLWAGSHVRGDLVPMREMSDAFLQEVRDCPGTPQAGIAQRIAGTTCAFEGRFTAARHHLELALAGYDPQRDRPLALRFGHDVGVAAESYLALSLWPLGQTRRAHELADAAIEHARHSGHAPTMAYSRAYRCIFEALRQDAAAAAPHAQALLELSQQHGMQWWLASGIFFNGWTRWHLGDVQQGIAAMRRGMELCREHGLSMPPLVFESLMAEAELHTGMAEEALARLEQMVLRVRRNGEHWLEAEILRRRGELMGRLVPSAADRAAAVLREALEVARGQQAQAFELRAALSLARLQHGNGGIEPGTRSELGRLCEALDASALAGGLGSQDLPELKEARAFLAVVA